METASYEDDLQRWLETWDPFFERVPLNSYKDGRALVGETKVGGKTIQEFRRQTISEEMRLELVNWASRTAADVDPILRRLFTRYRISPIRVLDLVGSWKAYVVRHKAGIESSAYADSQARRKRHSEALMKSAEILNLWKPLFPYAFLVPRYPESADLEMIAKTLRELSPPQAHAPGKIEIKNCARGLSQLFRGSTSRPLPEYVGQIILTAFPDLWNPAGDIKEAAKKLLKQRKPNRRNGR
jgi:hypothetical protein